MGVDPMPPGITVGYSQNRFITHRTVRRGESANRSVRD